MPFRLRLHDADSPLVHKQEVVGLAVTVLKWELAHSDALGSGQVQGIEILHRPARFGQEGVNVLACLFLWGHGRPLWGLLTSTSALLGNTECPECCTLSGFNRLKYSTARRVK